MWVSGFFPPKPPPTYSPISTVLEASAPDHFPTDWLTCAVDCADACRYSLPFCQYAIDVRGSMHWWEVDWHNTVSSMITAASLKPFSTSPTCHVSGASHSGSRPASTSFQSVSVHLRVFTPAPK